MAATPFSPSSASRSPSSARRARRLSEERLAQEAMLLATKADIREELDRLGAPMSRRRGR